MCCYLLQLLKQEFGTVCHCILNLIWNRVPLHLRCGGVSAGGPNYICSLRQSAVCLYFFLPGPHKNTSHVRRSLFEKSAEDRPQNALAMCRHCRFPIVLRRVLLSPATSETRIGNCVPLHLESNLEPCAITSALRRCISGGSQLYQHPETVRRMPLFFSCPACKKIHPTSAGACSEEST